MYFRRIALFFSIAFLLFVGGSRAAFAEQGPLAARGSSRAAAPAADPPGVKGPFVGPSIAPASFDGDLRRLPRKAAPVQRRVVPRLLPSVSTRAPTLTGPLDPVRQTSTGIVRATVPITSFDGLANTGWYPPSANGDVGPNNYVQVVNIQIGIYDKAGNLLASPTFDQLFAGQNDPAGNPCGNAENYGDTIAVYDATVQRWLLGDAGHPVDVNYVDQPPYYECIAVSKTSDPTQGWWLYALPATDDGIHSNNLLNDFAKFGVWNDGIYMTANMFSSDSYVNPRVWALNRDDLINGLPLRHVYFDLSSSYASFLPANLRGGPYFAAPADGTPEIFAAIDEPNLLHLYTLHVPDWDALNTAYVTQLPDLTVANFVMPRAYVPEGGGATAQVLDPLGDRLMMHLQYANIGGQESLWVNHTVASNADGTGRTGVRWYEIRDPFGTPSVYQQSTYLPADSLYRWMGSIAVDQYGDAALGYSVSSASTYPGIRYTGRLVIGVPNTLDPAERTLLQGGGWQTFSNRWGDYTSMTVDPTDGCTFWYTNEYYATPASTDWSTRIGSFKVYSGCGTGVPPTITIYDWYFPQILKNATP
ncbi:MAG: hypothetical protein M1482_08115 [Chloroflexi bacterium]|nr:hypothetical protein [Chloroflexota bacterium]